MGSCSMITKACLISRHWRFFPMRVKEGLVVTPTTYYTFTHSTCYYPKTSCVIQKKSSSFPHCAALYFRCRNSCHLWKRKIWKFWRRSWLLLKRSSSLVRRRKLKPPQGKTVILIHKFIVPLLSVSLQMPKPDHNLVWTNPDHNQDPMRDKSVLRFLC